MMMVDEKDRLMLFAFHKQHNVTTQRMEMLLANAQPPTSAHKSPNNTTQHTETLLATGHAASDRIKRGANNNGRLLVEPTGRPQQATAWMAPLAAISINKDTAAAAGVGVEPLSGTLRGGYGTVCVMSTFTCIPGATAELWTTPAFRLSWPEWAGWGPLELASQS